MSTITPVTNLTEDFNGADSLAAIKTVVTNLNTDKAEKTLTVNSKALSTNPVLTTADIADSTDKRYVTDAQRTVLGNTSGTNTGDQTLPVKASGAEIDTGTDDAKFLTAKAVNDSHNIPMVAPGSLGNILNSNGTDWISSAPTGTVVSVASDYLYASADTERTSAATEYTKVKEIQVYQGGVFRVKFDLKNQGGSAVYGRVYKNGSAFGTEQTSSSNIYATKSEDLTFAAGDLIQLYIKGSTDDVFAQNFRIYCNHAARVPLVNTN